MTDIPLQLILASQSPRRLQLLQQMGVDCSVFAANVDESYRASELACDVVRRLALSKARSVYDTEVLSRTNGIEQACVVLGADTLVVCDGEILGKPVNKSDALRMMSLLSNNCHKVVTGAGIVCANSQESLVVATSVFFGPVSPAQAESYWNSGEPVDKAGGYAIQGLGGSFVKSIAGSYSNVVGLPLFETRGLLESAGIRVL